MIEAGKVSVICIAFNHEDWIIEALESVKLQDYYNKELLIVDNGSSDTTGDKIKEWIAQQSTYLQVQTFYLDEPKPYCQLFNELLRQSTGMYVVDLSGDDVLYPDHLSLSIEELSRVQDAAFIFSDAHLLDDRGEVRTFYPRSDAGDLREEIELSNIYETMVRKNVICSATVVFNAAILKKEGGYDESLYYEDFDVQTRLARKYPVLFSDHIGIVKRIHAKSMSAAQYKRYKSKMLPSTVKVCQKILNQNYLEEENQALKERILYELKHALWSGNFGPAKDLIALGEELGIKSLKFSFYRFWSKKTWDFSWLYGVLTKG